MICRRFPSPPPTGPVRDRAPLALAVGLLAAVILAATAPAARAAEPATYEVRRGDNLSVIASRFGTSVRDLKRDNGLSSDLIHVGQKLTLKKPFQRTSRQDVRWRRPFDKKGRILRGFGPYKEGNIMKARSGVDMAAPVGTRVRCPANGVVRHLGYMDGFGVLVIIEHGGGWHTVFSPLDEDALRLRVGQALLRGDEIGRTAAPPDDEGPPYLHLELRRDEKAVKPDRLLE